MVTQEDVRLERPVKVIWNDVLDVLAKKVQPKIFDNWIRPLVLIRLTTDEAVIGAPNQFALQSIERSHVPAIRDALSAVLKRQVSVRLEETEPAQEDDYQPTIASITVMPAPEPLDAKFAREFGYAPVDNSNLNQRYTFANFVVGSHNRFCHSAAMAVSTNPGQAYNPLFIYGGVGLGKTHLLQAIGNHIVLHRPRTRVRYMSGEKFTNELIQCIRDERMFDFQKRYRQIEILLIDDVQFLEGKERTQEEFFHTFNAITHSGGQIVLTSDRPPQALSKLEERLRSRFAAGLIADVQPADFETRLAILQKKCELQNVSVPSDVLEFIASNFVGNIRELEGALIRATALVNLTGTALTLSSVREILGPSVPQKPKVNLTVDAIVYAVAEYFQVEPSEIKSAKRSAHVALPRHIAAYFCCELMKMSYPRIGQALNRAHTTAMHSVQTVRTMIAEDPEMARVIRKISKQLGV